MRTQGRNYERSAKQLSAVFIEYTYAKQHFEIMQILQFRPKCG